MKNFKIISYYTIGTGYENEIKNLIDSLNKFSLDYYIQKIENLGNWYRNTEYKGQFIKTMLNKFNMPLVFIDSDAVIKSYPTLFDNLDCDIGVHYFNPHKDIHILLSGTIYIQKNERTIDLLDRWIKLNETTGKVLEQKNLQKIIDENQVKDLKVYKLPPEYTCIFDTMKYIKNPVILHMQASRRYKKSLK